MKYISEMLSNCFTIKVEEKVDSNREVSTSEDRVLQTTTNAAWVSVQLLYNSYTTVRPDDTIFESYISYENILNNNLKYKETARTIYNKMGKWKYR